MATKKPTTGTVKKIRPSVWKKIHNSLNDTQKAAAKAKAMLACQFSEATFYKKMGESDKLKNFQKQAIAIAYGLTVETMFPERKRRLKKHTVAA